MSGFAGVALETGDDYTPWGVALSALWRRPSSDTYWAEQMYDQGTLPFEHLMIDDTIHNIAAGVHDAAIEDWLKALLRYQASGRHIVVALFPEMNGNWTPYGQEEPLDHRAFIRAYRNIVTTGKTMGLTREHVLWCFAPNDRGFPGDTLASWYPGDEWCDVIGGSLYSWGGIFEGAPYETFTDLTDRYVREVRTFTNRPIVITQTGCVNDSGNVAWLDDAVFYTDTYTNIEGFIWFSIDWFRYEPGPHAFRLQASGLDSSPPLHWFEEEPMKHLSSVTRLKWEPYLGKTDTLVSMRLLGRYPVKVQDFWVPAVEAMEQALIATGYENPCDYIGSYLKRPIAGTDYWSWHSYGGAVDLDYGGDNPDSPDHPGVDKNPHLHRRIPWGDPGFGVEFQLTEPQVKAVLAIRTNNDKPVWRWLGTSIGDTMHFEPACTPDDIKTGIMEDNMFTHFEIGQEYAEWESVSWWLYMLKGGTIDANGNSSQVQSKLPWKTNVRLVQAEDFMLIAELVGLSNANRIALTDSGLYRWGKELASLRQKAYT